MAYKYLIGKALLDTIHNVKTVANKVGKLDNEFRTPALELIAGVECYETTLIEEGTRLSLDVGKVYFCERLHSERSRIIKEIKQGEIVADVFCGVGPLAIRVAKEKQCVVYANDLNPECFKYLKANIKLNKLSHLLKAYCMDGRAFITELFRIMKEK